MHELQADLRHLLQTLQSGTHQARSAAEPVRPRKPTARFLVRSPVAWTVGLAAVLAALLFWMLQGNATGGFLSRWTSGGTALSGSLAVLPLVNNTGKPDSEYIADGITQTLIDSLSQLPNLKVISRNRPVTAGGGFRATPLS